jgi:phosphate butyryltransferase
MPLPGFDELRRLADARSAPVPLVVAGGAEPTVIEALNVAALRGWISPVLTGPRSEILATHPDASRFDILDTETPAQAAVAALRSGQARILMKGRVSTPDLLRAILDPARGLRTGQPIAQVVLMELPRDDRRFLMSDTGILIRPTFEQKLDIVRHVAAVAHALGEATPRVALVAASESVNDHMPETREAAEIEALHRRGLLTGCHVQGPLSFDLAYEADAGRKKQVSGPVVGAADALVFPDLLSANLTVKAIMHTADCRFGGVLRGTSHPVAFMSRADRTGTRLNSLTLALALLDTWDRGAD